MLQFNSQQFSVIKSRVSQQVIDNIIADNKVVLSFDVLVPPDNRATWNHYYFCSDHGVRLTWDRNKPLEHYCPVDGQLFTGEPYDGAWWRWLNGLNAKACNQLGLLWQLTNNPIYLDKVRDILLQYAKYYPDYEPHGGIPYNGPGKANAQTLCEANCHLDFALGYDFIKAGLSNQDQLYIERRLLREGADFLMAHRTKQLHNHEMKINSTIGVIGLILQDEDYIQFALNTDYGLHYQLNHGLKGEGFWFEGSVHYHYYALQALLAYEKLARNTKYSIRSNPNYYTMLTFPLQLVLNTGDFPRMNDCVAGQEKITEAHIFEFAYSEFEDPIFAAALASTYQNISRDNMDALLYGVEKLPEVQPLAAKNVHFPIVGLTQLTDKKSNNQMVLKHSLYGGEHDHYDRLGLTLIKHGQEILPDLGTSGYGAELHYGYYKNSATHNTLTVNQSNQTPANPTVLNCQEIDDAVFVDTWVDWRLPVATVDSHTLVHWDEESYKDIQFRRSMLWLGFAAIEINQVTNPHLQQLDLTWHTRGQCLSQMTGAPIESPLVGPLARMTDCRVNPVNKEIKVFTYDVKQETPYKQFMYCEGAEDWLTGLAPDNPATSNLHYVLLRSKRALLKNIVLHDLSGDCGLVSVEWQDDQLKVELSKKNITKIVLIDFIKGRVSL
ncbi:heparinase II/III domain-containing protein [Psychromonas sp. PT13]|uniref:heparinase II/III domain-containing protein n=1 Tax=Psychromonas sp. PT13 TaxID=3439547 RepID=UPI003EBB6053